MDLTSLNPPLIYVQADFCPLFLPLINLRHAALVRSAYLNCVANQIFTGKNTPLFINHYLKIFGTLCCIVPNITLSLIYQTENRS